MWKQTKNCKQLNISPDGYTLTLPAGVSGFLDFTEDLPCDSKVKGVSTGFCECGAGLKIAAGACNPDWNTDDAFACK